MPEIKLGDVVKLKSGGPEMTVIKIGKFGYDDRLQSAQCSWFKSSNEVERNVFPIEALECVSTKG